MTSNEYDRNLDNWSNTEFLFQFAKKNNIKNIPIFIEKISKNLEELEDTIESIRNTDGRFIKLFEPISQSEKNKIISFRKGKIPNNPLRLYSIKIEDNIFVITGGAIKLSMKMQDHPTTKKELLKLKAARDYLNQYQILNEDAFYELINEL